MPLFTLDFRDSLGLINGRKDCLFFLSTIQQVVASSERDDVAATGLSSCNESGLYNVMLQVYVSGLIIQ